MENCGSDSALLKIIEHEVKKEGLPQELREISGLRKYDIKKILLEVSEGSEIGAKICDYYLGYLE